LTVVELAGSTIHMMHFKENEKKKKLVALRLSAVLGGFLVTIAYMKTFDEDGNRSGSSS